MAKITFAGHTLRLPRSRLLRTMLGAALIIGGLLGFLPVLGYWMIPMGLAVLAIDFAFARRLHRRLTIAMGNGLHRRWPGLARKLGCGEPRPHRKG